jgi:very-short-patch-repair endonuclease
VSELEQALAFQIKAVGLPEPLRQYRPVVDRMYRADFCWPRSNLIVEVDGGGFVAGRHTRGEGFEKDCERGNELVLAGWKVLHVTGRHIESGQAVAWIERALTDG